MTTKRTFFWIPIALLCLVLSMFRGAIVSESTAVESAESQGWSDLEVESSHWFFVPFRGCDDSDAAAFKVRGKNPRGDEAKALVCCGAIFKNCTVRSR